MVKLAMRRHTKEANHCDILSQTATVERSRHVVCVFFPRHRTADDELQRPMPESAHLNGEDDHNRDRREQLDSSELRGRAESGELHCQLRAILEIASFSSRGYGRRRGRRAEKRVCTGRARLESELWLRVCTAIYLIVAGQLFL